MEAEKSTMIEILEILEKKGFKERFKPCDGLLQCIETGTLWKPEDLEVIAFYRFEGEKDMGDVSVIYVLSDGEGMQGLIIDAYGPYADGDLAECIRKLKLTREAMLHNMHEHEEMDVDAIGIY